MIRPIIQAPDERLLQKSEPVFPARTVLGTLIGDLIDTRHKYQAFGLSAVQIGVPLRVVVVDPRGFHGFRVLMNPEVLEIGGDIIEGTEGCMSIAWGKKTFKVTRASRARIRFMDVHGEERTAVCAAFATRLICHEIDHLDGKLIGGSHDDRRSDQPARVPEDAALPTAAGGTGDGDPAAGLRPGTDPDRAASGA